MATDTLLPGAEPHKAFRHQGRFLLGRTGQGPRRGRCQLRPPARGDAGPGRRVGLRQSTTGRLILRLIQPTAGGVRFERSPSSRPASARCAACGSGDADHLPGPILPEPDDGGADRGEGIAIHESARRRQEAARARGGPPAEGGAQPRADASVPARVQRRATAARRHRAGAGLNPMPIIADEPISALDAPHPGASHQPPGGLRREQFNLTYLFIAHDLRCRAHQRPRGRHVPWLIVELADSQEPYTAASPPIRRLHPPFRFLIPLRSADAIFWKEIRRARSISPQGAASTARCRKRFERCDKRSEPMLQVAPRHWVSCQFLLMMELKPCISNSMSVMRSDR